MDGRCEQTFLPSFQQDSYSGFCRWRSYFVDLFPESCTSSSSLSDDKLQKVAHREAQVLATARAKLLGDNRTSLAYDKYPDSAKLAVVDVRIRLSYDPWHLSTTKLLDTLVASHMRILHSVDNLRTIMRSSYPSEPILAEAAAQQWNSFRVDAKEAAMTQDFVVDPVIAIVRDMVNNNLLDVGEVGEMCARLLLTLAHDAAIIRTFNNQGFGRLYFSQHVPLVTFLKELLSEDVANAFLTSKGDLPGRLFEEIMLMDEFQHATIGFTHFVKCDNNIDLNADAAAKLLARGAAVITRVNHEKADVGIPILRHPDARPLLHPNNVTILWVEVKNRLSKCSLSNIYIDAEKAGFFSPCTESQSRRPYINLVMELGVKASANKGSKPYHIPVRASQIRNSRSNPKELAHVRYAINVYGCSQAAYKVVGRADEAALRGILQKDGIFDIYTRGDDEDLKAIIRNQLPTVDNDRLNRGFKPPPAGDEFFPM